MNDKNLWKIVKEMGILDHLTCFLRNLYADQEAIVEPDTEQQIGSKLQKEYIRLYIVYLTYMQNTSCKMPSWKKHKLDSRVPGNLRQADDTTLMEGSEEELKTLLMKVKESEKGGLKLNIQKTKIMASGPITSWHTDEETTETVTGFIFLGSKITAESDCIHEIERNFLLGRKAMTNLDSILKSRDITLPKKVHLVKLWFFPVVWL